MKADHQIIFRRRPLAMRLWLSYRGWRRHLGVVASIRAAFFVSLG
jgi:hypothetical protein